MAKEALLKVIEAEDKADSLVKEAKDKAKNIILESEKKSKNNYNDAIIKAKTECDRLKKQAEDDIKDDLNSIREESLEKCKSIRDIPQYKFDEAKKLLIERIVK